jgi:hypothetical protein
MGIRVMRGSLWHQTARGLTRLTAFARQAMLSRPMLVLTCAVIVVIAAVFSCLSGTETRAVAALQQHLDRSYSLAWKVVPLPATKITSDWCDSTGACTALGLRDGAFVRVRIELDRAPYVHIARGLGDLSHGDVSMSCTSLSHCLIAGSSYQGVHGVIYRSADGGLVWTRLPTPPSDGFDSIECRSETACLAAGPDVAVWTSDAGNHWNIAQLPPSLHGIDGYIACVTSNVCVNASGPAIDPGFALETRNYGRSWTSLKVPSGRFIEMWPAACAPEAGCSIVRQQRTPPEVVPIRLTVSLAHVDAQGNVLGLSRSVSSKIIGVLSASCWQANACAIAGIGIGTAFVWITQNGGASWSQTQVPRNIDTLNFLNCSSSVSCIGIGILEHGSDVLRLLEAKIK